ncbi:MAG: VTT domain-containing protein [Clostridia bacterium]|nr:VTT domain-containing protein [Clostridia bacterium]MBR5428742.1 VTT domain-containing protein [Clostridia bacterium]
MQRETKSRALGRFINITGVTMLCLSVLLLLLSQYGDFELIRLQYVELTDKLYEIQLAVASLDAKWMILIIIELLFMLKSVLPIPLSFMFVITGMVFPYAEAVIINAVGMALLMSIRYMWGVKFDIGKLDKKLVSSAIIRKTFETKYGKGLILLLTRLIPWTPTNKISRIYGAEQYPFDRYLLISLIGYSPKILSYSKIGRSIYNPISYEFLAPVIVLFAIGGVSLLIFGAIFFRVDS